MNHFNTYLVLFINDSQNLCRFVNCVTFTLRKKLMSIMLKTTHKLRLLGMSLVLLSLCACGDDFNEPQKEEPGGEEIKVPNKISLSYSDDGGKSFSGEYEAVRIGEYYWMNSNFHHIEGHNVQRKDIEKILTIYRMDPAHFNVSMEDFNKYFGSYYTRNEIENITSYGRMHENKDSLSNHAWTLPHPDAFRQLFGMCGDARIDAVIRYLSCKTNDNAASIAVPGSGWISKMNNNRYEFNLMPTGAIFNGPNDWEPHWGEGMIQADKGDMYGLLQAVIYPTSATLTIYIHDYPQIYDYKLWHYMPMRWCRKLTEAELGYRLYINSNQTDIKKLTLTESIPSGYSELPNGYIRGFYVQYILDKPNPEKTVAQIIEMAKYLR